MQGVYVYTQHFRNGYDVRQGQFLKRCTTGLNTASFLRKVFPPSHAPYKQSKCLININPNCSDSRKYHLIILYE